MNDEQSERTALDVQRNFEAVAHEDTAGRGNAEIREFAARRLADFKVPRKILFMAEIPKGATGKLQRIGLAAKLGLGE